MNGRRHLILVCFFLSGMSSLIYEVVWMRRLELVFGSTTLAASAILAAFMGGLALGSWLIGRWSSRLQAARSASVLLVVYALLEWGIGLYALLVSSLFDGLPSLYRWALGFHHLEDTTLDPVQFILASLLLVIPTMLMGGTLPLLACWTIQRTKGIGLTTGMLYAVNTAGAVAGAALAGFLLIPLFGLSRTTLIAVGLNLGIGLVALLVGRAQTPAEEAYRVSGPARGDSSTGQTRSLPMLAALLTAGVSGFVAMGYEVVWTRLLALALGSSTYAFTVMVATFLLGLATGSAIGSRVADRLRRPVLALALCEAGIGVAVFCSQQAFSELPGLFLMLFSWVGHSWWLLLVGQFSLAFLVMLVPTIGLGALFPLLIRLATGGITAIGASVGRVYALNTVGNVLGATATGLWLIPVLGVHSTLLSLLLTNLAIGLLLLLVAECRLSVKMAAASGLVAGMVGMVVWTPPWQPLTMTSGVYKEAPALLKLYDSPKEALRVLKGIELLYYKDGQTATVSVVEKPLTTQTRHLALAVDGKVDASTGADMATQILSGHLPLLMKPFAEKVLVIGYASGMTVGAVLQHPVQRVTAVEIEPAVLEASRYFDEFNHRPLEDPRVQMILADGRTYLQVTETEFDVIISEPSNPWMSGPAKLFTEEFFRLARARLTDRGVFVQWLQLYGMAPEHVRALVRTFQAVFPSVMVFQTAPGDVVLLGSREPLRLDYRGLAARLAVPAVTSDLRRIGLGDASAILTTFLMGPREVAGFVGRGLHNTDDNGLIEFAAPRSLYADTIVENREALKQAGTRVWNYVTNVGETDDEWATMLMGVARRALAVEDRDQAEAASEQALRLAPSPEAFWLLGQSYAYHESPVSAERAWQEALRLDPSYGPARVNLARIALNQGRLREALRHLAALRPAKQRNPVSAFLRGVAFYRQGRVREAKEAFQMAQSARHHQELPFVHYYLGQAFTKLGRKALARTHQEAFLADLDLVRLFWEAKADPAGLLSAEALTKGPKAVRVEEGAIRLFERQVLTPLTHFYQGLTSFLLGYEEKAEQQFLEVLQTIGPEAASPMTHYYLGLTYQRLNRPELAATHLRLVLDHQGSAEGLAAIRAEARRHLARLSTNRQEA